MAAMVATQFHVVFTSPVLLHHRPKMVTEMQYKNKNEEGKCTIYAGITMARFVRAWCHYLLSR